MAANRRRAFSASKRLHARHTSRRICPPSPPPGGRSCSARRLKSFSRPSPNSGEMIIFQSRGSPAFCQRSRTFRRHNDFALVAKSAGFVALRCTVAGDVAPFARHCPLVLFGEYITRTTHRWVELAPTATRPIMRTALVPASRSPGVSNNRPHTGRPGKRFVFRGPFGTAEAESGTPARLQFSWPRPNNSAMAAWESPTIAMPTLLRNRS